MAYLVEARVGVVKHGTRNSYFSGEFFVLASLELDCQRMDYTGVILNILWMNSHHKGHGFEKAMLSLRLLFIC